jgi:hypothetical protein
MNNLTKGKFMIRTMILCVFVSNAVYAASQNPPAQQKGKSAQEIFADIDAIFEGANKDDSIKMFPCIMAQTCIEIFLAYEPASSHHDQLHALYLRSITDPERQAKANRRIKGWKEEVPESNAKVLLNAIGKSYLPALQAVQKAQKNAPRLLKK